MKHLVGLTISVLVHLAIGWLLFVAVANQEPRQKKLEKQPVPLTLSMFVSKPKLEPIRNQKSEREPKTLPIVKPVTKIINKAHQPRRINKKLAKTVKNKSTSKTLLKKKRPLKKKTVKKKPENKKQGKKIKTIAKKKRVKVKHVKKPQPSQKPNVRRENHPPSNPVIKTKRATKPHPGNKNMARKIVKPKPSPPPRKVLKQSPNSAQVVSRPKPKATDNKKLIGVFKASVRNAIERHKRYPNAARRRGQQGKVIVAFTLLRNGTVSQVRITQSSGYKKLDNAALKAIKGINRRIPIPSQLNKSSWNFSIPIQFSFR